MEWNQIGLSVVLVVVRYCSFLVGFLLLNVTICRELMNVSEAIRLLSRCLAFYLRNLRLGLN